MPWQEEILRLTHFYVKDEAIFFLRCFSQTEQDASALQKSSRRTFLGRFSLVLSTDRDADEAL